MTDDFRAEETWRVFRIMAEFVEGIEELSGISPAAAIFGSARTPAGHPHYESAVEMARRLGKIGFNIITGGGPGIMEAANMGAKESKVRSIGVGIELPREQNFNPYVEERVEFRYFFVRKVMFLKYSDAVVVFPGGFGTMDEMFESLTLMQTHKIPWKPVVLFNKEWFGGLVDFFRKTMLEGNEYISPEDLDLFLLTDDMDEAVDYIAKHRPAGKNKVQFRFNNFEYLD